jgi:PAS domain S-box-containing protein
MEQTAAEVRRLKSCINDLLGVLSLPAMWSGHEPSRIAGTLLDVLLGILRLDFVYFRLGGSSGSAPVELVRVAGRRNPAAGPQEVGRALAPLLAEMSVSRLVVPNPLGEGKVRIVPLRLTIQDAVGVVVAASQRADFPTDVEALLLRVAANQAGIGLQEARRVSDQEHTAEEERRAHLWFLESIDSVNRAIQGTNDLEQMMHDVLEAVLSIFNCDRAWLVYPCDPEAASWHVPMERTRPEFPGALALGAELPMDADAAGVFQAARASKKAVRFGPGSERPVPAQLADVFSIQSIMAMALYPKVDKPYMFGLHQCSYPRNWDEKEERLFQETGRRLEDGLTSLLMFRNLRESEAKLEEEREALRRSESYLADAQRLSHTGSFALNVTTGEMTHSSQEHTRLYGFDAGRGVPSVEQFWERIHPDDRDSVVAVFDTAVAQKSDFAVDFRILPPDGTVRYAAAVGHPVFNSAGDLVEYVGTVMDVSDHRRAEQERERLRQAEADLAHISRVTTMGELTASLAHEITQPIAAAVTDAYACGRWLTRDLPDLEEARQAASRVSEDLRRASDIIGRIRLLFKKSAPERKLVDVNEVIREMIVLLRDEANRFSISIRPDVADDLPKVMADRVQLQQVLMNLMLNGIDAMRDTDGAGELTVKSQRGGDGQLLISVSDTGVGLPPGRAEQIFDAFFTTKPHGTGMGLPISRSIVEAHGGRLWAAAKPGRGATFQFTVPGEIEAGLHSDPTHLR